MFQNKKKKVEMILKILHNVRRNFQNFIFEIFREKNENSAVYVRTQTVKVYTFSTTVKDEISEGW